jgi:hypothetical protein
VICRLKPVFSAVDDVETDSNDWFSDLRTGGEHFFHASNQRLHVTSRKIRSRQFVVEYIFRIGLNFIFKIKFKLNLYYIWPKFWTKIWKFSVLDLIFFLKSNSPFSTYFRINISFANSSAILTSST